MEQFIVRDLKMVAKKIEKINDKLNNIVEKLKKPNKKRIIRKNTKIEEVYKCINKSKKGMTTADVQNKTGFTKKSVSVLLYKLKMRGDIENKIRGVYFSKK